MIAVEERVQDKAEALDAKLRGASPQQILKAAIEAFPGKIALVSSFGAESAVLLHMAAQIDPHIPVLFLETGMLFGQTLDYRKSLTAQLGLTNVQDLRPDPVALSTMDPKNKLWQTSTDACCAIRKVQPLDQALLGYEAWITGRKRFQSSARANLRVVEVNEAGQIKINPLANWSKAELDAYAAEHALPAHPLVAQGYPSIGCWPCTKPVEEGEDARSGRWSDSEKIECGIHVSHVP
jgi:phosphoadenosine phosphosulfate reductase